ncbi:hypothetical protein C5S29_11330 [ANME-1 cluster archaeon GoMg3.2]|nr:hypothetical protein [ANME-1 cluster archaeon GoMg3.2]
MDVIKEMSNRNVKQKSDMSVSAGVGRDDINSNIKGRWKRRMKFGKLVVCLAVSLTMQGGSGGRFPPRLKFKSFFFVLLSSEKEGRDKIIYDTFLDVGDRTEDTFIKVYVPNHEGFEECRKYFNIKDIPAFVVTTDCKIGNDGIMFPDDGPKNILSFKSGFFIENIAQSPQKLRDVIYQIHLACRDNSLDEVNWKINKEKIATILGAIWKEIKGSVNFSKTL